MTRSLRRGLSAVAVLAALAGPVTAARADTPWDPGHVGLRLALATDHAFGESYFVVGAGVSYYVLPGLAVGLDGIQWFGGDPSITVVSPQVRYVAVPLGWPVLPYAGSFYTHYFVGEPFADLDTIGARLGLETYQSGIILGGGAVVERTVSECSEDCTSIYPEVSVGFTF